MPAFPTRRDALELGALALLCVLAVGPAHLLPDARALGRPTRDLYDHLALLDAWFLHTKDWAYPDGGSLVPPDLFGMILAAPLLAWGDTFGRALAYNFGLVARLWFAAAGAWALGRRSGSGLVAGVAFGLSPFLYGEVYTGEAETLSAWPLPVMALLLEVGGARALLAAGAVGAVGAIGSWYYGSFMAVYVAGWTLLNARTLGRQALLPCVTFAGLIALPALVYARFLAAPDQLFRGLDMVTYLEKQPRALAQMVSDPATWLTEPPAGATHDDRLGIAILAFATLGLLDRTWRTRWGWLVVTLGGLALAIGPVLYYNGSPLTNLTPYHLLAQLPLFDLMRLPHRWMLVASLGLALLAARGARGAPVVAAALVFLETVWFGAPEDASVPRAPVADVAGPVLDLPPRTLGGQDARGLYLLWQRTHRQPIAYSLSMSAWGGTIAEEPLFIAMAAVDNRDRIAESPVDAAQFRQGTFAGRVAAYRRDDIPSDDLVGAGDRVRALGFTTVLLHTFLYDETDRARAIEIATAALGPVNEASAEFLRWDLLKPTAEE